MLAWFTGKTIPTEARPQTTSFNVIQKLLMCRLRWVGQILRLGSENPAFQALVTHHEMNKPGNLLMDVPPHHSFNHLVAIAQDCSYWCSIVNSIPASD